MADFSGGPGFLAFVATFAMVGGAILLFRSLSKHLRKVRTHPPEGERAVVTDASAAEADTATEPGGDAASGTPESER